MMKTTITNLLHAGIPPTQVQQLSGHRNIQSVNNYAVASLEQQNEMSDVLCNARKEDTAIVPSDTASRPNQPSHMSHVHNTTTENTYQTQAAATAGIYSGAVIYGGAFTINVATTSTPKSPPRKRRRAVIFDISSTENSQDL